MIATRDGQTFRNGGAMFAFQSQINFYLHSTMEYQHMRWTKE